MTQLLNRPSEPTPTRPEEPGRTPPVATATATALCAVFALAGWLVGEGPLARILFGLAYLAGGTQATIEAVSGLFQRRLTIDLLMILAALGAALLGDEAEGAVLLFLFSLSGTLEAFALYRTTRSIDALIQLRPREASLVREGQEETRVSIDALRIGDLVRVRPGERFPVDGTIRDGDTWADEATLTGESTPVPKSAGAPVFAGTINGQGSVLVEMTRAVADTTLEKIVRMVREAQAEKTASQRLIESWRGPYVAGVLAASTFVFFSALVLHRDENRDSPADAFYHAMVVLVVSSPCAVVIGTPAVLLSAIARAARQGVLFKGGRHLEILGSVDVIAFDKTGTITVGKPRVVSVWATGDLEPDKLVRLAAAVEQHSEHHLSEAVLAEANRRGLTLPAIDEFEAHTGTGVHARVEGIWVGVGREDLFRSHDKPIPDGIREQAERFRERGTTALLVVIDGLGPGREADSTGWLGGVLAVADQPRPEAAPTIQALKENGSVRVVILTGDHERVARAIGEELGADAVRAELMPAEKVVELRRWILAGHTVAMIGDGVNDAPALAAADVGIAMGGAGTDVALEVADVVLMSDDLTALPFAVWLSRQARRRTAQNMAFAFGMIALLLISSFFRLPLWLGVVGHEGSTLLVVLNGLRLLWERPPSNLRRTRTAIPSKTVWSVPPSYGKDTDLSPGPIAPLSYPPVAPPGSGPV